MPTLYLLMAKSTILSNEKGDGFAIADTKSGTEWDTFSMTSQSLAGYGSGNIYQIRFYVSAKAGRWSLHGNKVGTTTDKGTLYHPPDYEWRSVTYSGLDLYQNDVDDFEISIINTSPTGSILYVDTIFAQFFFRGDLTGSIQVKNIDNGTSVSQDMGYITDGSYDISQVAVIGTDVYFNWKMANENVKLWKYDSITNTITEIKDCGTNTELPPDNMRGISYDEDNTLYFVLQDTSDLKYYLYTYEISTDALTKGDEYNIALQLDRDTDSYEKVFSMQSDEVYQVTENGVESFSNSSFDAPIISITDSYLMTSNGKLYEKSFDSTIDFTVNLKNNGQPYDTLYYSYTTDQAIPVNFSIWNFDSSNWDLVDYEIFTGYFNERTFLIDSPYYHPTTYDINLRFVVSGISEFQLYL